MYEAVAGLAIVIHYHGTPITPIEALSVLTGHHFFVSFWRPDGIEMVSQIASTFSIDNGAFSAFMAGDAVDWSRYRDFVQEWSLPNMNFHVIPDVIGGTWQENVKLIESWNEKRSAPVWHMGEPIEMAIELADGFETICIGGNVGIYENIGSVVWWERMSELLDAITVEGVPICKIHGLKMLDPALRSIPFYSADSTNLARNICSQSGMSRKCAALLLSDRIEATQAATRWKGSPQQEYMSFE